MLTTEIEKKISNNEKNVHLILKMMNLFKEWLFIKIIKDLKFKKFGIL